MMGWDGMGRGRTKWNGRHWRVGVTSGRGRDRVGLDQTERDEIKELIKGWDGKDRMEMMGS